MVPGSAMALQDHPVRSGPVGADTLGRRVGLLLIGPTVADATGPSRRGDLRDRTDPTYENLIGGCPGPTCGGGGEPVWAAKDRRPDGGSDRLRHRHISGCRGRVGGGGGSVGGCGEEWCSCGRVALGVRGIVRRPRSRSLSCPGSRARAARQGVRSGRWKAELPTGAGPDASVSAARLAALPMSPTRREVTDRRQPVPTIAGRVRVAARPHLSCESCSGTSTGRTSLPISAGTPKGIFPQSTSPFPPLPVTPI